MNIDYQFTEISNFDARRGYRRCSSRGVAVSISGQASADCDFWRNRSGNIVLRFSSQGYVFSFEATHKSGKPIQDTDLDKFSGQVTELAHLWLIEGVDDVPTTC